MKECRFLTLFIVILIAVLLGCQTSETALQPPDPAVASASSADIQEISKVFSQLEKTWNGKDVKGYKSLWLPGAEIITKRGQTLIVTAEEDPGMLDRMKAEWRKYKVDPNKIQVNADKASAVVYFDSSDGGLTMDYRLERKDGTWLITQQSAR
jgi:hypothetical protein